MMLSERLVAEALGLRDDALAMFARAADLALEHAKIVQAEHDAEEPPF